MGPKQLLFGPHGAGLCLSAADPQTVWAGGKGTNSPPCVAFGQMLRIFDHQASSALPFAFVWALPHLFSDPALPSGNRGRIIIITIYYSTYACCQGISHTLFHLLLTPTL